MARLLIAALLVFVGCSKPVSKELKGSPKTIAHLRVFMLSKAPMEERGDEPVLMILDMPGGVSSLFAANNGNASTYFKSGGAQLGSGDLPQVQQAAVKLLREAAKHKSRMTQVTSFPLPKEEMVRFYVRTPEHVYMAEASLTELINDESPFAPLFDAGMDVLLPLSAHYHNEVKRRR